MSTTTVLAISGSLRSRSSNTELLRAASLLAGPDVSVTLYEGLAELPHFNPDLDTQGAILPTEVQQLHESVGNARALLISSPEYAHGVPGSLKNALDWLVSGPAMPGMPVGLLNASSRSLFAHAQLEETLRTMSATLVPEAVRLIALDGRRLDAAGIAADRELSVSIREAVDALVRASAQRDQGIWSGLSSSPDTGPTSSF